MNDQTLAQLSLDLPRLSVVDGHATTTSLQVAEDFGKRHDDVLKAIGRLECSEEFRLRNFAETPYIHPQNGNTYKMYNLTRDGFTFLAMGFTGSKAAAWKEKYIQAFNLMEEKLKEQSRSGLALVKPEPGNLTALEAMRNQFVAQMDVLIDHERRLQLVDGRLDTLEAERQAVKDALTELPEPTVEAPVETTRVKLIKLVDSIVKLGGMDHQAVWRRLYRELTLRCHFDVAARQRFAPKKTKLQIVEEAGQMENLYAIAFEWLETIRKGVA